MPQQAVLDVLRLERLAQKRIVAQVQHAGRKVNASAPVGVHFSDFFGGQRLELPLLARRVGSRYGKCLDVAHSSSLFGSICCTCIAIVRSSWAVTTQTATCEFAAFTRRRSSPWASLAAASRTTPERSRPCKISVRDFTSCSPMPP